MGHKTHPIGFRLGGIKDWNSRWFASKQSDYRNLVLEDTAIRKTIEDDAKDAGISKVEIERNAQDVTVAIHTARPGIVIGRGGARVEQLKASLEGLTHKRTRVNVVEVRQPELNAYLVARNIADALERRVAYRRAIRQAVTRAMQAGTLGIKVLCSGRLGGGEIARKEKAMQGRVPLHTLRADIDYGLAEAATLMGRIGVKVWIYKGEIIPRKETEEDEFEQTDSIEFTIKSENTTDASTENNSNLTLDSLPADAVKTENATDIVTADDILVEATIPKETALEVESIQVSVTNPKAVKETKSKTIAAKLKSATETKIKATAAKPKPATETKIKATAAKLKSATETKIKATAAKPKPATETKTKATAAKPKPATIIKTKIVKDEGA